MYNYREEMKNDILEAIRENYTAEEIAEQMTDRDSFAETLNDELWTDDSVTGNASGSYTFSRATAKEYVTENIDLATEALREFCLDSDTIAEHFLEEDWEYFDVTIRCYLLAGLIWEVLEEIEKAA